MGVACCGGRDDFNNLIAELDDIKSLNQLSNWNARFVEHIESDHQLLSERDVII